VQYKKNYLETHAQAAIFYFSEVMWRGDVVDTLVNGTLSAGLLGANNRWRGQMRQSCQGTLKSY
jgi:hypothetical protein